MSLGQRLRQKYPEIARLPRVDDVLWESILLECIKKEYAPFLAGLAWDLRSNGPVTSRALENGNRFTGLQLFGVEPFRTLLEAHFTRVSGLYMQGDQLTLHLLKKGEEPPFPQGEPPQEWKKGVDILRGFMEHAKKDGPIMVQLFPRTSPPQATALGILALGNFRAWIEEEIGALRLLPDNYLEVFPEGTLPELRMGRIGHLLHKGTWPRPPNA